MEEASISNSLSPPNTHLSNKPSCLNTGGKMSCLVIFNYQLTKALMFHLLFSLVVVCLSSPPPPAQLCHNEESIALLQFKQLFSINCSASDCYSDSAPNTENWKEGTDCCAWDGVTCHNTTAHVISLDLSCNCLYGTIYPNSSLFNLVHLQELILSDNNFNHSQILPSFGRFPNLTHLDLSFSRLSGQIQSPEEEEVSQGNNFPNSIFYLLKLQVLDLEGNTKLTGKLPSFINETLQHLRWLGLSSTGLTGELPNSIGQLQCLEELHLSNCNFSGTIPRSLGNLTRLTFLQFSSNHFSGKVPSSLSYLENLSSLDLSHNNFEGPIPQLFSNMSQLYYLDFSNNQLTGPIPSSVTGLPNLEFLLLGSNSINGTIPSSLFRLVNLNDLDLSSNNLSGIVELNIFAKLENLQNLDLSNSGLSLTTTNSTSFCFPNITTLQLSSCNITKIPEFLKTRNELLQMLDLSNNKLNEELNSLICNLHSLQYLDLSNNQFYGLIPTCLGNFSGQLTMLNLQRNNLHGTIPQTFGYASKLDTLDISHNGFQGVLPKSLANCTNLEILNVGNNLIEDVFPFWLENLPQLKVIVLRDNKFYGVIGQPRKRLAFANLHIIDVSHNNFTGTLPSKYFESWHSMMMVEEDKSHLNYMSSGYYGYYSVTIMNKGLEMVFVKILTMFKAIDFSHNKFNGKIPTSIGRLEALCVLNFSRNSLIGPIPLSLGNIIELESLDLSENKLSGEIPQQLTSLTFLAVLDISQNNLTGIIPRGHQFETFSNTSYGGNPGLCGFPLSKNCGFKVAESPSLPSPLSQNFKYKLYGFGWEAVSLGYACGVVLGLVIGSCIIRKKEEWIVRIFAVKMRHQKKRSKKVRYQHRRR